MERAIYRMGTEVKTNTATVQKFICDKCKVRKEAPHGLGFTWMKRLGWEVRRGLMVCGFCKRKYKKHEYVVFNGADIIGQWWIVQISRDGEQAIVMQETKEWSGGPLPQFRNGSVRRAGRYIKTAKWRITSMRDVVGLAE